MTIEDELAKDQPHGRRECLMCIWLRDQPVVGEWERALAKSPQDYSLASIHRLMVKRGATFGSTVVKSHRSAGHRR